MKKKVFGWILFSLGIGILGFNLFTLPAFYGSPVFTWILGFVVWPGLLMWGGWKLAHPKSKEEIAKKEREKEEGVL